MTMSWFKLHHELPGDYKLRKFSPQQKWAWVVLLCVASSSKERGVVPLQDEEGLADYCDFESVQDFQFFVDKLRQKGMIEPVEGGIKISHWEDRQHEKKSDRPQAVRDRVARYRAKKKEEDVTVTRSNAEKRDVTPCNAQTRLDQIQIRSDTDQIRLDESEEEGIAAAAAPLLLPDSRSSQDEQPTVDCQVVAPVERIEEVKGSGKLQQTVKRSAALNEQIVNELGSCYNQFKPSRWSEFRPVLTLSKDTVRLFGYLWDFSGRDLARAKQVISEGMAFAKCDPFFSGVAPGANGTALNRPGFRFFLEKSRYEFWPERCPGNADDIHSCPLSDVQVQQMKGHYEKKEVQDANPAIQKLRSLGILQ